MTGPLTAETWDEAVAHASLSPEPIACPDCRSHQLGVFDGESDAARVRWRVACPGCGRGAAVERALRGEALPVLETERLRLTDWRVSPAHVAGFWEMYSDPDVVRHVGGLLVPSEEQASGWVARMMASVAARYPPRTGTWAVEERDGRVVGFALVKPLALSAGRDPTGRPEIEVGWHLTQATWGRGYASEFGRRLLRYVFEDLDQPHATALVEPDNHASSKLCRRLGLVYEAKTSEYYDETLLLYRATR